MINIRPSVMAFAEAMEIVLRANDHKGGWNGCSDHYLYTKLEEEFCELQKTLSVEYGTEYGQENISFTKDTPHEATDLANICMMIWDNTSKRATEQVGKNK